VTRGCVGPKLFLQFQVFITPWGLASTNQAKAIKAIEESNALSRELLESNRELISAIRESTAAHRQAP
jgi:hypothetical protein